MLRTEIYSHHYFVLRKDDMIGDRKAPIFKLLPGGKTPSVLAKLIGGFTHLN